MSAPLSSPRTVPIGVVICSLTLLFVGLAFLGTGLLFLVAPESLRDAGFGQDVALGSRVIIMLAFSAVAAALAWTAWWLIRLSPSAFQKARGLALGLAGAFAIRLLRGEGSVPDWLIVVAAVAMAGYLTLSPVRALFRPPSV
jgi:hypothetical protein